MDGKMSVKQVIEGQLLTENQSSIEADVKQKNGLVEEQISPLHFTEAHFFSLPSQGNIYTLSSLTDAKGFTKLLVASLQRNVYCIEYSGGRPCIREVPFTYIPSGAEIVSIDAFNQSVIKEDYIIGITLIKKNEQSGLNTHFFNIYSDWDLYSDSRLEEVSQNCLSIPLKYIPYHLYHTNIPSANSKWETVWLLSGSDFAVHLFRSDEESHSYQETESKEIFPEFNKVIGITLFMQILYSEDGLRRITTTSGEGGFVQIFKVSLKSESPEVTGTQSLSWDYPSPCVRLFTPHTTTIMPNILLEVTKKKPLREKKEDCFPHLVVSNTLESCYVYSNLLESTTGCHLPETDVHDVVTCSIVCDINNDGYNEVIVGTYGQVVLMYKHLPKEDKWKSYHTIHVPSPVLSLCYVDLVGEGVSQLIIMTSTGIHIYQHNPEMLASLILQRLLRLMHSSSEARLDANEVQNG